VVSQLYIREDAGINVILERQASKIFRMACVNPDCSYMHDATGLLLPPVLQPNPDISGIGVSLTALKLSGKVAAAIKKALGAIWGTSG
jgi:hypothetical protein